MREILMGYHRHFEDKTRSRKRLLLFGNSTAESGLNPALLPIAAPFTPVQLSTVLKAAIQHICDLSILF
jgi:hypothetical protein